jgi:hypothetical protein
VVFRKYEALEKFSLANVASIDTRESLTKHFNPLRLVSISSVSLFVILWEPPYHRGGHQAFFYKADLLLSLILKLVFH